MPDKLEDRPAALLPGNNTLLLCSSVHQEEDDPEGDADERRDDGKSSIAPAPGAIIEEALTQLGTRKSIADVWCTCERKPDEAVPQQGCVRNEDGENVVNAVHASPVEDLSCGVGLNVLTDAHEHQSCTC